jgi:hypothetical protein
MVCSVLVVAPNKSINLWLVAVGDFMSIYLGGILGSVNDNWIGESQSDCKL